jgi:UDP-glucuronate decarboxylase
VCCDYGISRSNSIAAAAWSSYSGLSFDDALSLVVQATGETNIKLEMVAAIRRTLTEEGTKNPTSILITGANGVLGRALLPKLQRGHVSVFPFYSTDGDLIRSSHELDGAVVKNEIGTIVHLANPRVYTSSVALGDSLNMLKNVLDVCRQHRIKLVFPSTWEVFTGYETRQLYANEATPMFPKGTYAESKMLAERLVDHFVDFYRLDCLKLRICPVYGLGSEKPRFIHTFIKKALRNAGIVTHTYRNGDPYLELLHIDDLSVIMSELIQNDLIGTYHIGGGSFLSTYEVANLIVQTTKSSSTIRKTKIDDFAPNIILDDKKLFSLGVLCEIKKCSFEERLPELIDLHNSSAKIDCPEKSL